MANREPTKTQIFEVDSEVKTTKTTVTNQAYNEPDKRASEQMLDTEEPGNILKDEGTRVRTSKPRRGKTAKSKEEVSVLDNKKGRLTFSKRSQSRFILFHKMYNVITVTSSNNDDFLNVLLDYFLNNNKEFKEKMFNL